MMDPTGQLTRATRGDRDALRRVVEHWLPTIRRWALVTCGDAVLAEDAVQESLIRLLRSIGDYDPTRPFGPWLKTVVCNAARNELTKRGRQRQRDASAVPAPETRSHPGRRIDLARLSARARDAFVDLSPRQREVLDLVDLQGHTAVEAAEQLGITPGAVRGQLFVARRTIRSRLALGGEVLPLLREA